MEAKLFLGYRISSDLKLELQKNIPVGWSRARSEDKEFIGIYFEHSQPTLQEVRRAAQIILSTLEKTHPNVRFASSALMLFPQLFLG